MAVESPMINFNRKNPYVIQAKQKYEILMRQYELVSKDMIVHNILILLYSLIIPVAYLLLHIEVVYGIIGMMANIFCIGIWDYLMIKNTIKDPINSEIDKLITLESNEVIKINLEFVQDLLYKLNTCVGNVTSWLLIFRGICITILSLSIVANILLIIALL